MTLNTKRPTRKSISESLAIRVIDNYSKQFREAASEMHRRLSSSPNWSDYGQQLQARFWSVLRHGLTTTHSQMLGETLSLALGTHFLRENKDWLE